MIDAGPRRRLTGKDRRPVFRKLVENDALLGVHLVPRARSGQRCQEQHVAHVHSIPAGRLGDAPAALRLVYVSRPMTKEPRSGSCATECAARRRECRDLQGGCTLAEFPKPIPCRGLEADEDTPTPEMRLSSTTSTSRSRIRRNSRTTSAMGRGRKYTGLR